MIDETIKSGYPVLTRKIPPERSKDDRFSEETIYNQEQERKGNKRKNVYTRNEIEAKEER